MNPKQRKVIPSNNRNRILQKKRGGDRKAEEIFVQFKKMEAIKIQESIFIRDC